jgi:hypothetical protein
MAEVNKKEGEDYWSRSRLLGSDTRFIMKKENFPKERNS